VPKSSGEEVADSLGKLIQRTLRARLYRELTAGLGPGVNELTYPVLSGLDRVGSCSAAELSPAVGLDRSGVSRRADRLVDAGLISKVPDARDSRAVLLVLTEAGKGAVTILRRRLADRIDDALLSWAPQERRAFAEGLRRFVDDGPFTDQPTT
jgi:DNA-binding MarR family transcriptional regulator